MFWQRKRPTNVKDAGHLSVISAADPADFGGIVRIELAIAQDTAHNAQLKAVAMSHPESETNLGLAGAGQTISVGVHFHLLPNGEQKLQFMLEEPNGSISVAEIRITIANIGGLAKTTTELLKSYGTPVFFTGPCDSRMYPYGAHTAWFDRPDAKDHVDRLLEQGQISTEEALHLRQFVDNGYLMVEGLIDNVLVDEVCCEIDDAISNGYQGYKFGSSQRIEHLHLHYPAIRSLWLDERHRRYADLIFGAAARPCQTLTYVFGSQQDAHQDTIHLTPFPAGYMCGTWIALQDVSPDSGELVVYPGSHRERRVRLAEADCAKVANGDWAQFGRTVCGEWADMLTRYEPFVYRPKKGTVLIWHENLLHAGSVRKDQTLERRSIVIHSFADGAVAYYDSTGLHGSAVRREALLQD